MTDTLPQNILVIEDDVEACDNLRDILELDGHHVDIAHSVKTALEGGALAEASIILLDWQLPDATALDVLPRLAELAPDAEVIIVTGHGDFDRAVAALRQGAADYLLKPINPQALTSSLERLAQRRWLALEKQRATEQLVQSERLAAIGEAMTGLAHESRNALQRSQAYLEMLAVEVADQPEAVELVQRIQEAQHHLHQLYEEVRQYAAPIRVEPHPCSIPELVRETWHYLRHAYASRDVDLAIHPAEFDTDPDARCHADRFMLQQVIRNILENSLAACSDPVRIDCTCRVEEWDNTNWFVISLRDNGPGLNAEQKTRIFDPFYTTKTRGTGLGMTLCRRIVEAHGGRIAVGPGPGAEIVVTLPHHVRRD